MCLAALSLDRSDRFPLVLAANRDEYLARPASPLAWWSARPGDPSILSGRDLEAGGTWLGLTASGRLALLTNVREGGKQSATAPSRGGLVTDWLESAEDTSTFWRRHAALPYNGFNIIAADVRSGDWFWGSNRATDTVHFERGLYGLSNAELDTPWPKVVTLKHRLATVVDEVCQASESVFVLAWRLFMALADKGLVAEPDLPSTGVPREWERLLSASFIDARERGYGTRCSTVVITERSGGRFGEHGAESSTTHMFELTHSTDSAFERPLRALSGDVFVEIDGMRHVALPGWPLPA
jgi:uncharacterized protein with NRDE domain